MTKAEYVELLRDKRSERDLACPAWDETAGCQCPHGLGALLGGIFGGKSQAQKIQEAEAAKQAQLKTQEMQQSLQKGARDIH